MCPAGEMLLSWWQRHLCDPQDETECSRLLGSTAPEADAAYWPTLRALVAQGKTAAARELLQSHAALRAAYASGGAGGADDHTQPS